MRMIGRVAALGGVILATACVSPKQEPAPQAASRPAQPTPPSARAPVPPPTPTRAFEDLALTPGNWVYSAAPDGPRASYGAAAGDAQFSVRCDRGSRRILLSREGAGGGQMVVRTSYGARTLPATSQGGAAPHVVASLSANDPLLDQMAFSRGRYVVTVAGQEELVLPAWPEPARVVEECRS
jgi:hypothetical protein